MAGNDQVAELESQVTILEKKITDLTKMLETATAEGGDDVAKAVELQGQVTELTGQLEELSKTLEKVSSALEETTLQNEALAKLTTAQREVFNSYEKAADKKKFLNMAEEEKEKEVKKREVADDIVIVEGQTIRKSAVGESVFVVMKAQAERIATNEKNLEIEKAAREKAVLSKTADDKYAHVPGTTDERADMLGAIAKMAEPLQKAFYKVFEQSEKLGAAGFGKLGHQGGGDGGAKEKSPINKAVLDFETKAAEVQARDKISKSQAFSKARKEFPDLYKAYQDAGTEGATTQ